MPATATAAEHIVTYARAFLTAYAYLPVIYFMSLIYVFICVDSAHPYPQLLKME